MNSVITYCIGTHATTSANELLWQDTAGSLLVTYLETPEKMEALGRRRDGIWEYHPEGLRTCLERYWVKYKKPIIITENRVCEETDFLRLQAIQDYAYIVHKAIGYGIDVRGYYFWSTRDNFEWHLGPSMRFGL